MDNCNKHHKYTDIAMRKALISLNSLRFSVPISSTSIDTHSHSHVHNRMEQRHFSALKASASSCVQQQLDTYLSIRGLLKLNGHLRYSILPSPPISRFNAHRYLYTFKVNPFHHFLLITIFCKAKKWKLNHLNETPSIYLTMRITRQRKKKNEMNILSISISIIQQVIWYENKSN